MDSFMHWAIIQDCYFPRIVCESPYFEEQLKVSGFEDRFNEISKLISEFEKDTGEEFFDHVSSLHRSVLKYIESVVSDDNQSIKVTTPQYEYLYREFYNPAIVTHDKLVRIDIKEASFNSCKVLNEALRQYDTFGDLIDTIGKDYHSSVTMYYGRYAKKLRQVVFGTLRKNKRLLNKSLVDMEKVIINSIISDIGIDEVVHRDHDSVTYDTSQIASECVLSRLKDNPYLSMVKLETFTVEALRKGYVEVHDSGMVLPKAIPGDFHAEVWAEYMGRPINEEYLVFSKDGILCKRLQKLSDFD